MCQKKKDCVDLNSKCSENICACKSAYYYNETEQVCMPGKLSISVIGTVTGLICDEKKNPDKQIFTKKYVFLQALVTNVVLMMNVHLSFQFVI